jgi:hypothetical protein
MSEGITPETGSDGGTIEAAASAIRGLFDGESSPDQQAAPDTDDAPQADAETEADDIPAQADEDDESDDGEDTEPADDDDGEDNPAQTRKYTVKVDGKTMEVDESELIKGYQTEAHTTRKLQALADDRRAFEAEKQVTVAERQKYAQGLEQLTAYLRSVAPQPPSRDLLESDPVAYLQQQRDFEDHMARMRFAEAERQKVGQQQQAETAKQREALLRNESQKVLTKIPAWTDEKTATTEKGAIAQYLVSVGEYSHEEVGSLVDSRALVIARKAWLYDELMGKKATVEKKVAEAPKFQKPGVQKSVKSQAQRRVEDKFKRLRSSGDVRDAASLMRDFL